MIIILHGALGSAEQLQPIQKSFSEKGLDCRVVNFPGHGGEAIPAEGYSIAFFADFLQKELEKNGGPADIFGYSMGGYVATYLAAQHPGLIRKIITLGTKWEWSPDIATREVKMLDAGKIREKVPAFAAALEARHGKEWEKVLSSTAQMMLQMGENPPVTDTVMQSVSIPVYIWRGTEDMMVTEAESRHTHAQISGSVYREWEGMPHPVEKCDTAALAEEVYRTISA